MNKFVVISTVGRHAADCLTLTNTHVVAMLVETTNDFKEEGRVYSTTDSIQIRPKQIRQSSKGYYYNGDKRTYLTDAQTKALTIALPALKEIALANKGSY